MQFLSMSLERASTAAASVDHLFYFLLAVSAFFLTLIFVLLFYFAVRYRRRFPDQAAEHISEPIALEITWIVIPFLITIVMFVWGAKLYSDQSRPPANAEEIFVVGKQWMWKLQHQEGIREINELHVPIGRPIKLVMTSEDVIHDFFVPAFRVKKDVLPGRYTSIWFEANKAGTYHFFCSQYCGTDHAQMRGWVTVMEPAEYERWLNGGAPRDTMVSSGERLFHSLGCTSCHQASDTDRGPALGAVFGRVRPLQDGRTALADEAYLRESIVNPHARIVAGYQSLMPTFQGQVSEEQILQLIAYMKSLATPERKKQ